MAKTNGPKRVAIYARVSSAGQRDRDLSVPEQERLVREFCDKRGWLVVEVFKDEAKSGADTINRPGLKRMMTAACSASHPFDLILTRDQARFGRGDDDANLRKKLRDHGVAIDNIVAPTGDMEAPLTPAGSFIERIQTAVDIQQREMSTIHMVAGQKAKARRGGLPGAQATCYGYDQDWVSENRGKPTRVPIVDKKQARIVREIFRRYVKGDSLNKITKWLNNSGIEAPRGIAWYDTTVRQMLSNETYLGRLVYGKVKKVKHPRTGTKMNSFRDDADVIRYDNAFPAIIDQATFDRAQAILSRNERSRPQGGHPGNTLRGIGKCGVCGWHLAHQRHTQTGKWYYFCGHVKTNGASASNPLCKGILQAEYVDQVVALFLRRILSTSVTDLREQVRRYNAAAKDLVGLSATETLDIAIQEHEGAAANLVGAIAKGTNSAAILKRLEATEEKLSELRRQRGAIASATFVPPIEVDEVLQARSGIRDAIREGDTEQMRSLLAAICSGVYVDWSKRENPVVNFNYRYEDMRKPQRVEVTDAEHKVIQAELAALEAQGKFKRPDRSAAILVDEDLENTLMPYSVKITVARAPLTFVPKWSITNAERAAEDAVQQIAEALAS